MSFGKAIIAGVVGGIVVNLVDFVMHGMIMANTYPKYEVFAREHANPLHFTFVAICMSIMAAILFAKTRGSWADGLMGGVSFGFWLGMIAFFAPFYNSLIFEGFPYYISWCWGGINLIGYLVLGAVLGLIYTKQ